MILTIAIIAISFTFGGLSHHLYLRIRPHGFIDVENNQLKKLEINIPFDEITKKRSLSIKVRSRK